MGVEKNKAGDRAGDLASKREGAEMNLPGAKLMASGELGKMQMYPTPFQRKVFWSALASLSIVVLGAFLVGLVFLTSQVMAYLQPVLAPLAAAAIIAYLLEPLISRVERVGVSRRRGFIIVYVLFLCAMIGLSVMIFVPGFKQFRELAKENKLEKIEDTFSKFVREKVKLLTTKINFGKGKEGTDVVNQWLDSIEDSLRANVGGIGKKFFSYLNKGFSGLLGVVGYLIGAFLVPIYLYYFLKEARRIEENWTDYLPLKKSSFKREVVATLKEINTYLIAFFRGQMIVSIIDGALIGGCLALMGMPYALLIGVCVALLGIIPYIGNLICLIPAIAIAIFHFSVPANQYEWLGDKIWAYPLIVVLIFVVVQQIDGILIAPKIVGDSVGLHPLTIIFSVLFWSLLLGGILGALLAVPLTASIKVILRRYVWEKKAIALE